MSKLNSKTIKMVEIAVFAAIIAVLSQITIPMPVGVPVTLQTFAIALCGYMIGAKFGTISVAVYLAIGAAGVPVFSGFLGGFARLFQVTGGFLWGFLLMSLACGIGIKFNNKTIAVIFGVIGLAACHFLGALQFSVVSTRSLYESFLLVSMPFLVKDVVSVVLAYALSFVLNNRLEKNGLKL